MTETHAEDLYGSVFRSGVGLRVCLWASSSSDGLPAAALERSVQSVLRAIECSLISVRHKSASNPQAAPFITPELPVRIHLLADSPSTLNLVEALGSGLLDDRTELLVRKVSERAGTLIEQADVLVVLEDRSEPESDDAIREGLIRGRVVIHIPGAADPIQLHTFECGRQPFRQSDLRAQIAPLFEVPADDAPSPVKATSIWSRLCALQSNPHEVVFLETDPNAGFSRYVDLAGSLWHDAVVTLHGLFNPDAGEPERLHADDVVFQRANRLARHYAGVHEFVVVLTSVLVSFAACLLLGGQIRGFLPAVVAGALPIALGGLAQLYARRSAWFEKSRGYRELAEERRAQLLNGSTGIDARAPERWTRRVVDAYVRYTGHNESTSAEVSGRGLARLSVELHALHVRDAQLQGLANRGLRWLAFAFFGLAVVLGARLAFVRSPVLTLALIIALALALCATMIRLRLKLRSVADHATQASNRLAELRASSATTDSEPMWELRARC